MANTLKTASVLAFERKLSNSDGLLYSGNWDLKKSEQLWNPIKVENKDVRGTISNRLKNAIQNDPAKLDAEIQKPNLQRVDVAALPFNCDTIKLTFTLRVLGNLVQPSACNDQNYQAALGEVVSRYVEEHGFRELAGRYAMNIANGRFLWRNRLGAEAVEIHVQQIVDKKVKVEWTFDALQTSLRDFTSVGSDLRAGLAEAIRLGLTGEQYTFFRIEAFARVGSGQEVFPSQELILDKGNDNSKSKTLYQVGGVAAIHSQKIGNALRTIDTWFPEADEVGPIAVEPYGSVTNRGKAYRQPKDKQDFYTLLDNWVIQKKVPPVEQQHYVMATLVRGGVFGEKGD